MSENDIEPEIYHLKFTDGKTFDIKKEDIAKFPRCSLNCYIENPNDCDKDGFYNIDHDSNHFENFQAYISSPQYSISELSEEEQISLYNSCLLYNMDTQFLLDQGCRYVAFDKLLNYCEDTKDCLLSAEYDDITNIYYNYKFIHDYSDIDSQKIYFYVMDELVTGMRLKELEQIFKYLSFIHIAIIRYSIYFNTVDDYDLIFSPIFHSLFPHLEYADITFLNQRQTEFEFIKLRYKSHMTPTYSLLSHLGISNSHFILHQLDLRGVTSNKLADFLINNPYSQDVNEVLFNDNLSKSLHKKYFLNALSNNMYPHLSVLNLSYFNLSPNIVDFTTIIDETHFDNLKELNLSHNSFNYHQFMLLCCSLTKKDFFQLDTLNFSFMDLKDDSIRDLCNLLIGNKSIKPTHLYLNNNNISANGILLLGNIIEQGRLNRLIHLDISYNLLTDADFAPLFNGIKHKCLFLLEEFNIRQYSKLLSSTLIDICQCIFSKSLPHLKTLDLSFYDFGPSSVSLLMNTLNNKTCTHVETINLCRHAISDKEYFGFTSLVVDDNLPNITYLNLESTTLGDNSLKFISVLLEKGKLSHLQHLYIGNNTFSIDSFMKLIYSIDRVKWPSLLTLSLKGSSLGDVGLIKLCSVIQSNSLPNLRYLYLDSCGLTDRSLSELTQVANSHFFMHLYTLNLSHNSYSYENAIIFTTSLQRQFYGELNYVNLSNSGLSVQARSSLIQLFKTSDMLYNQKVQILFV